MGLTAEQLDALPVGSVVKKGRVYLKVTVSTHRGMSVACWSNGDEGKRISSQMVGAVLVARPLPDDAEEVAADLEEWFTSRPSSLLRAAAILRGEQ